ncbi:MAG: hypothetical protein WBK76_04785 [Candidatus Saccharimonadales bacterium]
MSGFDTFHNITAILSKQFRVDDSAIEELRVILEKQHGREVNTKEAETVGRSLIHVVETLANGRTIVAREGDKHGG